MERGSSFGFGAVVEASPSSIHSGGSRDDHETRMRIEDWRLVYDESYPQIQMRFGNGPSFERFCPSEPASLAAVALKEGAWRQEEASA